MHNSRRTSLDGSGLRDRARGYSPRPVAAVQQRNFSDVTAAPKRVVHHATQPQQKPQVKNTLPQGNAAVQSHYVQKSAPIKRSPPIYPAQVQQKSYAQVPASSTKRSALFSAHKTHSKLMPTRRPQPVHKAMTSQAITNVPTLPVPKKSLFERTRISLSAHKKGYVLSVMAVLLFAVGAFVNVRSFMATQKIEAQVQAASERAEDGRPGVAAGYDETPVSVSSVNQYMVSPDMPRFLIIDKLSVFSRIKRVGVDAQNAVEAPKSVFDAGWYDGSAKPGESGAVFIDGHVSGPTKGGIFVNLKKLKVGDSVKVEMGNGIKYSYKVAATEKVPKDQVDMAKALRPYEQGKQGLNIMTCAGTYDKKSETYDYRFIVYAVRDN